MARQEDGGRVVEITSLFSVLSGLSSVHRYSMTKMTGPESVLEHTGWVAFVSCLLSMELNSIKPGTILMNETLTMALMHDVDEVVTGDISRVTKYRNENSIAVFKEMSRWGVEKVMGSIDLEEKVSGKLIDYHTNAKKGREGLIIAIADCMAVVYKLWEETVVRHNCSMTTHAGRLVDQLEDIRRRVDVEFEIKARHYLFGIIDQCVTIAETVVKMDEPIFGSNMRE
jgi:5'-deoxynucleotidase YfbR-like HD superfamily hydrolase